MPTLNIEGKRVTVDDSFMSLSPEQQNSTVDEIAKSLKISTKEQPSTLSDVARSAGRGLKKGFAEFMLAPGAAEAELMNVAGTGDIMEGVPTPQQYAAKLPKPATTAGRFAESVGEAVGNPASWIGPGSIAGKTAANVLGGLGAQAGEEITKDSTGRIIGGIVGAAAPRAALRTISPNRVPAIREEDLRILRNHGIEPMAGDVIGSKALRHQEEKGEYFGGGHSYSQNKERVARQFTRAVNRFMGEDSDLARPEVIERARERIGNELDRLARTVTIRFDRQFGDDLVNIERDLFSRGYAPEVTNEISALIDQTRAGFGGELRVQAGAGRQAASFEEALNAATGDVNRAMRGADPARMHMMNGRTYQDLTRKNGPLSGAIDAKDSKVSYFALRLRKALDDAMERTAQAPGTRPGVGRRRALEELREARRQWYAMLVISKSVVGTGEGAAEGLISPQKLRQWLTSSEDNKLAYAVAQTELQRLSRAGNAIMTPEKSSGTAERLISQMPTAVGLATGLAGRGVNSPAVQSYLKNQAAARYVPQTAPFPWSIYRGGLDALGPTDNGDALQ